MQTLETLLFAEKPPLNPFPGSRLIYYVLLKVPQSTKGHGGINVLSLQWDEWYGCGNSQCYFLYTWRNVKSRYLNLLYNKMFTAVIMSHVVSCSNWTEQVNLWYWPVVRPGCLWGNTSGYTYNRSRIHCVFIVTLRMLLYIK